VKTKKETIRFESCFVEHQPQKVTTPHSMGSTRLKHSKTKVFFLNHFLQWNSSFQNSWKLDAIWKSFQLLEVTSQSSWQHLAQFLALDV
jgi:hypothetical protein